MRLLMVGLLTVGCSTPALAQKGKGLGGLGLVKGSDTATCGEYGTSLHFEKTPKEAAKKAQKEEKLVFVVHVSGVFEETELT